MTKTLRNTLVLAVAVAFVGVAWAASLPSNDINRWVKVRLNIGPTWVQSNGITHIGAGGTTNDFPPQASGLANCVDSDMTATVTGARLGDVCTPSTNFGMDGGAAFSLEAQLFCFVSAPNTVRFRACAGRADAGTLDLPDGGYFATTFSHQS